MGRRSRRPTRRRPEAAEDRPRPEDARGASRTRRPILGEDDRGDLLVTHDQDRTRRVVDDLGRDRPEDHRGDRAVAAIPEDHEVGLPGARLLDDRRGRATAERQPLDFPFGQLQVRTASSSVPPRRGEAARIRRCRALLQRASSRRGKLGLRFYRADDAEPGAERPREPAQQVAGPICGARPVFLWRTGLARKDLLRASIIPGRAAKPLFRTARSPGFCRPETGASVRVRPIAARRRASLAEEVAASPPTRSTSRSRKTRRVESVATAAFAGRPLIPGASRRRSSRGRARARTHAPMTGPSRHERPVDRRRDCERIVDEGPVEAVELGRGTRARSGAHRPRSGGRRWPRPSPSRAAARTRPQAPQHLAAAPARRARRLRRPGRIRACSVTSRKCERQGSDGCARVRPPMPGRPLPRPGSDHVPLGRRCRVPRHPECANP